MLPLDNLETQPHIEPDDPRLVALRVRFETLQRDASELLAVAQAYVLYYCRPCQAQARDHCATCKIGKLRAVVKKHIPDV